MTREEIIEKAIDTFGNVNQLIVTIEECSELQKEITKSLRGENNRTHMIEEVADVEIMLLQLKRIYEISEKEVHAEMRKKLDRLEKRLDGISGNSKR